MTELNSPVIDFGAHMYPESVLPDYDDDPDAGVYERIGPVYSDPEVISEWFDTAGIDGAAFSMPYYMGHEDLERVSNANDALIEDVDGYDEFYALAALPTGAGGETAAEEFERCLDEGFNGGVIETLSYGIEPTDSEVEPIYEVAERTGAPLFVHPRIDDSLLEGALDDTYRLNAVFGREVALATSICTVVHTGLLDRHPDLNLVFHHTGGNIAGLIGRIHLQLDEGRWPGQEHVKSFEEFKNQVRDRVYIDTSGYFGYQGQLHTALDLFPPSQVLFGTDHPAEARTAEELRRFVDNTKAVCLERNAEETLGQNALDIMINT